MQLSANEKHIIDLLRGAEAHTVVTIIKNPPRDTVEYKIEVTRREFVSREVCDDE